MATRSTEEYLEAIYKLGGEREPLAISSLAERLSVSSPSVSEMVRKLAEQGLAAYEPYKGVTLTAEGQAQALAVIRRHRLWERFLTDTLGLPWDQVHEEACRLEHVTSPLVEERLAEFLEAPQTCPHGHPMPTALGEVTVEAARPLSALEPGQRGVVLWVPEEKVEMLQYLTALGLKPQATVQIEAVAPFQGPLTVRIGEAWHPLGWEVASQIMVRLL
jgi:DtxR family Mn-dependent transcriptional regulator